MKETLAIAVQNDRDGISSLTRGIEALACENRTTPVTRGR